MYVEYKPGEKYAGKIENANLAESIDAFTDCGQLLGSDDIVIDIDHVPKETIRAVIATFGIKTETVWTDRGCHLWFKKPVWFMKAKDGVCKLGFDVEQHTQKTRPAGMTVKRNGVARVVDNKGARQYMPDIFETASHKKPYKNLLGMEEGEGRNKALFEHRKALNGSRGWEEILSFINKNIFSEPLSDAEFNGIVRELPNDANPSDKFFKSSYIIENFQTVKYSGQLWFYDGREYVFDPDNDRLVRKIYALCEGENTSYIDEVIRQISYRSPVATTDTPFPIRLRNGIIMDGDFIPMKEYKEFTPYFIDIDYVPNCPPVKVVDDYIAALTSGDEDYKKLLLESLGFVMITDPERIRSLGKFFMFRGDGANGKGTLLQIMKAIYNAKNVTNLSIKQLVDDRFKVTMIGKLANLGDDIEAEAIDEAQLKVLKNISTADTVTTRHLYSESISTTFTAKLYFTTNTDIRSFEKGYAYKRRVVWMPMFNKVERPDPTFITKITTPEALQYWIYLMVDGYKRLYLNREWTECEIVNQYNAQYHEDNNICLQYARELDPDTEIAGKTITDIKEDFYMWTSDDRKFSPKLFRDAVWDLYKIGIGVKKVNGKSRRVFMRQSDTDQLIHN